MLSRQSALADTATNAFLHLAPAMSAKQGRREPGTRACLALREHRLDMLLTCSGSDPHVQHDQQSRHDRLIGPQFPACAPLRVPLKQHGGRAVRKGLYT